MPDARGRAQSHISASLVQRLIEEIWDPLETKVVLAVALLGDDQPVIEDDVLEYRSLKDGSRGDGSDRSDGERLQSALHRAVAHGILIALRDESERLWYVVATSDSMRRAHDGQFQIVDPDDLTPQRLTVSRPDIFGLYEQNIGVVTPIMADRLAEALRNYPEEWIRDAIGEAVSYNRRNWRYIQRILENWTTEGRADETNRRDHEEHLDSEKYLRGKYASLFRRR